MKMKNVFIPVDDKEVGTVTERELEDKIKDDDIDCVNEDIETLDDRSEIPDS